MVSIYSIVLLSFLWISDTDRQKDFNWLIGTWQNTEDKHSYESWVWNDSLGRHEGKGYRIPKGDTLVFETLSIEKMEDDYFYIAVVEENNGSVPFKMSKISSRGFSSENTKHDFPKTIAYRNKAGKLVATIAGNGKEITFSFKKIE
jgi:hypothetical protein